MSYSKEKKFKKLRKGHIWPAVVFFILSVIVTLLTSFVFMCLIIGTFAGDRLGAAWDDALTVGQMIAAGTSKEAERQTLDYLEEKSSLAEAVYIVDAHGQIEAGYGSATFLFGSDEAITVENKALTGQERVQVYSDSDEPYGIITLDGDIHLGAVIEKFVRESIDGEKFRLREILQREKKVLHEVPFWVGTELSDNRFVLAKSKIVFYTTDFSLAILIAIASAAVMALPLLFLFISLCSNISKQKRMSRLLATDDVTAGKSWLYFEYFADRELCAGRNANQLMALADVTLMKYGNYCTCHGVEAGEALLRRIDREISSLLGEGECCAHNGRSSFGLLLRCEDKAECESRVRDMLEKLPARLGHSVTFHAGIYFAEPVIRDGKKKAARRKDIEVADYYNCASAARTSLDDENRTAVLVFDQKLLEKQLWEHKVEEKMQGALEREEFQVYIQPKYNPVTEELAGAEALVRWINDEDGFISPGQFIPIFEKNGFITKLDDYMISHVAKLQAEWLEKGKDVVPVSVNVSRAHFANPDLAEHICKLVDEHGLPHHLIEIELTESAFFDDKNALLDTVRKLKGYGFDVSMDDFGAGYSSLNSLKDLPLDVLKLDADFFRGEDGEERGEIVVAQAIHLAKKLNMRIVAEGVEKKNQVDFLASQNCDMIQGFYFAKPMPAAEYEERLGSSENGKEREDDGQE